MSKVEKCDGLDKTMFEQPPRVLKGRQTETKENLVLVSQSLLIDFGVPSQVLP